jgi:hypothetical protein
MSPSASNGREQMQRTTAPRRVFRLIISLAYSQMGRGAGSVRSTVKPLAAREWRRSTSVRMVFERDRSRGGPSFNVMSFKYLLLRQRFHGRSRWSVHPNGWCCSHRRAVTGGVSLVDWSRHVGLFYLGRTDKRARRKRNFANTWPWGHELQDHKGACNCTCPRRDDCNTSRAYQTGHDGDKAPLRMQFGSE